MSSIRFQPGRSTSERDFTPRGTTRRQRFNRTNLDVHEILNGSKAAINRAKRLYGNIIKQSVFTQLFQTLLGKIDKQESLEGIHLTKIELQRPGIKEWNDEIGCFSDTDAYREKVIKLFADENLKQGEYELIETGGSSNCILTNTGEVQISEGFQAKLSDLTIKHLEKLILANKQRRDLPTTKTEEKDQINAQNEKIRRYIQRIEEDPEYCQISTRTKHIALNGNTIDQAENIQHQIIAEACSQVILEADLSTNIDKFEIRSEKEERLEERDSLNELAYAISEIISHRENFLLEWSEIDEDKETPQYLYEDEDREGIFCSSPESIHYVRKKTHQEANKAKDALEKAFFDMIFSLGIFDSIPITQQKNIEEVTQRNIRLYNLRKELDQLNDRRDETRIAEICDELTAEFELSLKTEAEYKLYTEYGLLSRMLRQESGKWICVWFDIKQIGAKNFVAFEEGHREITKLLIDSCEIPQELLVEMMEEEISTGSEQYYQYLEFYFLAEKVEEDPNFIKTLLKKNPQVVNKIYSILRSIGDSVTEEIKKTAKSYSDKLAQNPEEEGAMKYGDEGVSCFEPETYHLETIQNTVDEIRQATNCRVCIVVDDFDLARFSRIRGIPSQLITRIIKGAQRKAELELIACKNRENKGEDQAPKIIKLSDVAIEIIKKDSREEVREQLLDLVHEFSKAA